MGKAYSQQPGYTGWRTRDLLLAIARGERIITMDPRWRGKQVEYRPRDSREMLPWHVIGEPTGWVRGTFCKPE